MRPARAPEAAPDLFGARGDGAQKESSGGIDPAPCVTILMATYDGADFLPEQLDSFARQSHRRWRLIASDDGSRDATQQLLEAFAATACGQGNAVTCLRGPGRGAAANFLFLIRASDSDGPEADDWIAFADQDDIWLPDRLARGLVALHGHDGPALYCSRTLIRAQGETRTRLSAPRPHPPSFRNALVQNIASGNTILLNPAASRLVRAAAREAEEIVVHDWWIYQLVTGAGGLIVHDDAPTLIYRQHPDNHIGANDTALARLRRVWQLVRGDFVIWNIINIAALTRSAHRLTEENRDVLANFAALRSYRLAARLRALRALGLYRQTRSSTLALWVAAIIRRI